MDPQPRGTRRPRPRLTTNISLETSNHALTTSPTTGQVIKKPRGVSSSDNTSTTPSIHQSGKDASITIQGSYNDVGGDQYNINVGRKL